ncbi:MAG: PEP-CTERM sorting domain-containing protein [Microcystis aeruginosa BS13-02]|nr:PEP-CTERM sorting domain-containing protein [Microcystis aeruginosa BS13-02]
MAGIGAILTLSEAANASNFFTVADWEANNNITIVEGDKTFSNFNLSGVSGRESTDTITAQLISNVYQLTYNAIPVGDTNPLTQSGSLTYTVTINPSFANVFDFAQTSINAAQNTGSFSKNLSIPSLTPSTINTVQTGIFASGTTTINVTSSWTVTGDAFINQLSDQYTQSPTNPTPIAVPEPSAVLGLVALGLVGVVGRSVSKSLHHK